MTEPARAMLAATFARRFLLARYQAGGVVIDLESGNYYRVNRTAAFVCDALLRAPAPTAAAKSVANELHVDAEEAGRVIDEVVAGLDVPVFRGDIQGSYHFYPNETGYELRHGKNRVLEVSADGAQVRIAPGAAQVPASQLELYLRSLAPKLLFQNEVTVLHASSCVAAGKLIAFAGVSRAGKTTTARAFSAAGATLLSEDLVVLAPGTAPGAMITDGERRVHDWARDLTARLLGDPERPVSTAALAGETIQGPTTHLDGILFMDSARREGTEFRSAPLEDADALAELLRHDFLGASQAEAWRRFFRAAVALLGAIEARTMWAPDGLDGLAAAASRYISRTAS